MVITTDKEAVDGQVIGSAESPRLYIVKINAFG